MAKRDLVYWDSCLFTDYLNKTPDRIDLLVSVIDSVKRASCRIVTSAIAKVEVAFAAEERASKTLDPDTEAIIDELWQDHDTVQVAEFHDNIAQRARGLMRWAIVQGYSLGPMDAIHLATAQFVRATAFHTYDAGLPKYAVQIGCPVCPPYLSQPSLPHMP